MKSAEEYLNENELTGMLFCRNEELCQKDRDDFIDVIKQAQIDAIEETVKRCAEEAETKDVGHYDGEKWNPHNVIDKQSILNVATKMKEELIWNLI